MKSIKNIFINLYQRAAISTKFPVYVETYSRVDLQDKRIPTQMVAKITVKRTSLAEQSALDAGIKVAHPPKIQRKIIRPVEMIVTQTLKGIIGP